jgi:hypothetical protein
MTFRLQDLQNSLSSALYRHPPLASIPWSAIRRIGQSRLLSLTIVVPFLGSLLLFNQYVVDFLTLSPDVVARLVQRTGQSVGEVSRQVSLTRLYYAYFGLTFLGIGSFLFAMLCPTEVKSHASAREFVQTETSVVSRARLGLMLTQIADQYRWWSPEPDQPSGLIQKWAVPRDFESLFWAVISEIFEGMEGPMAEEAASVEAPEGEHTTTPP